MIPLKYQIKSEIIFCEFFFSANPRSLQHLSRLAIRDTIQTNSLHQWETFHELPIPVPLKGFLMFDGVSDTNRYYGGTSVASMPYL